MGARGLDKRGSFFKVKGSRIWDLSSASSAWLTGGAAGTQSCRLELGSPLAEPAGARGACLRAGLVLTAGPGFCDLILPHWLGTGAEMPHCRTLEGLIW